MILTCSRSELLDKALQARKLGASVEIVGAWAWARFGSKPNDTIRQSMLDLGYKWSRAKGRWYFVGAISTAIRRHSWQEITARYTPVQPEELAVVA